MPSAEITRAERQLDRCRRLHEQKPEDGFKLRDVELAELRYVRLASSEPTLRAWMGPDHPEGGGWR